MTAYTVAAEYDPLTAVRVHRPGLEAWSGAVDPANSLFEAPVVPERAAREHDRLVEAYEAHGVEVRSLAGDLASAGVLEELVREYAALPDDAPLEALTPHERLQLVLARARTDPHTDAATSLHLERPISNMYFQRDTTIVGDEGPILCDMAKPARRAEVPIVRDAWEGIGAEIVHRVTDGPIEGGEFLPAGEFALLGVSGRVDGEEVVLRTSYEAGRELLEVGAVGYGEVGLVRAPIEAEREHRAEHEHGSRLMHLLGWCNIAAEGLAVAFVDLAKAATVDVYRRRGDTYERDRSTSLFEYLTGQGYDVIDPAWSERWPTNFVTIDDGVVLALYEPDTDGAYDPADNPTVEALKDRGVEVVPDGTGLPTGALTAGAGGFHCMTTPITRG